MAGKFSFLPLSNKPGLKARVTATQNNDTKPRALPEHRASASAQVEMDDKDDEWYDTTSSSEATSPVKKMKSADIDSVVTVKQVDSEEEAQLLPYMPSLFSTDLPPSGLEIQIAYEIVNMKLRQRWLKQRGQIPVIEICQGVKSELRDQNYLWPPFSVKGKFKRRKPWCRENVFKHQLQWIDYFVREAQAQDPELMTESELWEQKKESVVPPELKLQVERRDILKLWDEWNEKKRAKTPAMAVDDVESGAEAGSLVIRKEQDADGNADELQKLNDSFEEAIVSTPTPRADGVEDDAHLWSNAGHD